MYHLLSLGGLAPSNKGELPIKGSRLLPPPPPAGGELPVMLRLDLTAPLTLPDDDAIGIAAGERPDVVAAPAAGCALYVTIRFTSCCWAWMSSRLIGAVGVAELAAAAAQAGAGGVFGSDPTGDLAAFWTAAAAAVALELLALVAECIRSVRETVIAPEAAELLSEAPAAAANPTEVEAAPPPGDLPPADVSGTSWRALDLGAQGSRSEEA